MKQIDTAKRTPINHIPTLLRETSRLSKPYFTESEERWVATALLFAILAICLSSAGIAVVMNFWRAAFYDAVQNRDQQSFISLLLVYKPTEGGFIPGYAALASLAVLSSTAQTYLSKLLAIRWRRWTTARMLSDWLAHKAYYRMELTRHLAVDNPDQRISEDIAALCSSSLGLMLDLVSRVTLFISFVSILWGMSAMLALFGVVVPGSLLWAALAYAIASTAIAHFVGHPLAELNASQQRVEADYRSSLLRVRENAEPIALYNGEAFEKRTLGNEFHAIVQNWRSIMNRSAMLALVAGLHGHGGTILPTVLLAPSYFAGVATLGIIMQAAEAFARVENSFAWIIDAYAELARLRSVVHRLGMLGQAIKAARQPADSVVRDPSNDSKIHIAALRLDLPNGEALLHDYHLTLEPGRSVLISGPSGAGKSTLFRLISGIWPFAQGRVQVPDGMFFLPQRPYIPPGSLRQAVCYPNDPQTFSDAAIERALVDIGLRRLTTSLDEIKPWAHILSGGEQQRLVAARAILAQPRWLFMDEPTSNLDAEARRSFYQALSSALPDATLVSITHHADDLQSLHNLHLVLKSHRL